jgi:YfiH family protein
MQRQTTTDGLGYYVSPLLCAAHVPHAFSTRIGGVSPPPFDSLNLGNPSSGEARDDWERIHENYRRLQRAIGCDGRERCWVHQVHGGDVARCDADFKSGAQADAIVGNDPRRLLAVRVADCVPVLLATEDGRHVAAAHAGWRGVIARVVSHAVRALVERSHASPTAIVAAIGPCIGFDAFEVGTDVLDAFEGEFKSPAFTKRNGDGMGDGKGRVDLRSAVRVQLLESGIRADRIDVVDRCTYRDRDEFFSHRRDRGVTGRMAALIAPRE